VSTINSILTDYWTVVAGFNCGEAVNFATIDWFPFGAAACKRYEFLNRVVLLPHQELLCKETMILARKRFSEEGRHTLSVEPAGQLCLKIAFVKLIRFQHQVIWSIKKLGAQTSISLGQMSTSHCCLCKCLCYVAYIICQCNTQPVCLNHGTTCLLIYHILFYNMSLLLLQ